MSVDRAINTKLVACDIAERLGCWEPFERRIIKNAIDRYGADAIWQLAQDAIDLSHVQDRPKRTIFFDLLRQHRTGG